MMPTLLAGGCGCGGSPSSPAPVTTAPVASFASFVEAAPDVPQPLPTVTVLASPDQPFPWWLVLLAVLLLLANRSRDSR